MVRNEQRQRERGRGGRRTSAQRKKRKKRIKDASLSTRGNMKATRRPWKGSRLWTVCTRGTREASGRFNDIAQPHAVFGANLVLTLEHNTL